MSGDGNSTEEYMGRKADILEVLCNLGHTNPTSISISHLSDNYFRQDTDEELEDCVEQMIEEG
ncbi:hypothetical protein GJ633_07140 [Halorubrum sp. CBA1125]|uniref:hypothetical protein n=1 Tax=Halorubrum sp. CBA1125 TaxID=2668072 RepID=UPI0012E70029|nr:hypothetical protein [Halorubrum sp. CBA1125]MUW14469.1 hypothetical protein [Halorubrum sp. CBA1125]